MADGTYTALTVVGAMDINGNSVIAGGTYATSILLNETFTLNIQGARVQLMDVQGTCIASDCRFIGQIDASSGGNTHSLDFYNCSFAASIRHRERCAIHREKLHIQRGQRCHSKRNHCSDPRMQNRQHAHRQHRDMLDNTFVSGGVVVVDIGANPLVVRGCHFYNATTITSSSKLLSFSNTIVEGALTAIAQQIEADGLKLDGSGSFTSTNAVTFLNSSLTSTAAWNLAATNLSTHKCDRGLQTFTINSTTGTTTLPSTEAS